MLTIENIAALVAQHQSAIAAQVQEFELRGRFLPFNSRPSIMGVINLSADSWYRESVCISTDQAVRRARVIAAQGADIVDVGAESSLSYAIRVDEPEQTSRLLPIVRELSDAGVLVSVETYGVDVARACLDAGACMLNLTGTSQIKKVFDMVAAHDAAVVICYVQGPNVRDVGDFDLTSDPIEMMREFFASQIELATRAGVQRILIDPGLGFYYRNLQDSATRISHQMRVFLNTFRLRTLGWPVCHALPHAFECFGEEVRCAEPFFAVLAALGKTSLFRTHEVPRVKAVLDTLSLHTPRV